MVRKSEKIHFRDLYGETQESVQQDNAVEKFLESIPQYPIN